MFTSYRAMGLIHSAMKEKNLPFPLSCMGKRNPSALERFKESDNGILFASGALWEGIDIPGDTLSLLVIVRLPFAVPDPIGDYEKSKYGDMEEYKAKVLVPDMLVKLKQGFGRLIRTEGDTGVCAILDSRIREGGAYRKQALASLPCCKVTSDVREVERFFLERKSSNYFV